MPVGTTIATHSPASRHLSAFLSGKDVTPYALMSDFVVTDTTASGVQGTAFLRLNRKLSQMTELSVRDFVQVHDHDANTDIFRGFVDQLTPWAADGKDWIDVAAVDHGILLDRFLPGPYRRPSESAKARVGYFWGIATSGYFNHHLTYVTATATCAKSVFAGTTLRRILDEIADDVSSACRWYVDQAGRLHFYTSETNAAPFDISGIGDVPAGAEIGPHDLSLSYDANDYINAVYVQGGNAAGTGWVYDRTAMARAGSPHPAAEPLVYPNSRTAARRDAVGLRYLSWFTTGVLRGSFTAYSPDDGWLAGQHLNVRSSAANINGSARIISVETRVLVNGKREYRIAFGAGRRGMAKRFRR